MFLHRRGMYIVSTVWIAMGLILCFSLYNVSSEEIDFQEVNFSHRDYNLETEQLDLESVVKTGDAIGENHVVKATASSSRPTTAIPPKKCKKCPQEDEKKLRLEMIKEKILKKLGVTHLPRANTSEQQLDGLPPVIHILQQEQEQFEKYKYEEQGDQGDNRYRDHQDVTTRRIMSFAKTTPYAKLRSSDNFYFKFSSKVRRNEVAKAYLWVYIQQRKLTQYTTTKLNIFRLTSPDGSRDKSELIESRKIDLTSNDGGWHRFNLTHVVQDWFADEWNNWGINVEALDHDGNSVVVTTPLDEGNPKRPFLEIRTQREDRHRVRRSVNDCRGGPRAGACCREPLTVNFKDLGMGDLVIHPLKYEAYYCKGACDGVGMSDQGGSHALFMHQLGIDRCCSPNKMSKMSMLFYDDDNTVMFVDVDDMIVDSCACS